MQRHLVVIPAFNEAEFISGVIDGLKRIGESDILVIDDGSRDKTAEIVRRLGVDVLSHSYNLGYGAALQTGFRFAMGRGYEYVVTMDADGQHDPASILSLFKRMEDEGADVVIGSRFLEGDYKMDFARRVGSWIFAKVARFYTGYRFTDPTSGFQLLNYKAYTCLATEEVYPLDYPDLNIIMLLHKKRFKVIEAPVHMSINNAGDSMHSGLKPFMYVVRMALAVIMILLRKEI
ncbi:MAG: glycosyltransferase family 2 protein [Thermodesulfovibrionia bacterium]